MKLLTFRKRQDLNLGIKTAAGVIDVATAAGDLVDTTDADIPETMTALLAGGRHALRTLTELATQADQHGAGAPWVLDEEDLVLGPCVPAPGKIICVGLNYRRHAREAGLSIPETPVLFSKFNNSIAAPHEDIPLPTVAHQYDYEVELAVVIGRRAHAVSEADALNYVFGYCNANDLSARDLQLRTSQWLLGKTLDKFMPIGPYLVTADDVSDPQALSLRCWLNGELRQNSTTADMVFPIAVLVSYISQYMTLEPGDVILTGTPEGVILGDADPRWLRPGDEVVIEVEGLGRLVNRMVSE